MCCPEFEDLLPGYTDLSAGDRARVDRHLWVCPACRGYADDLGWLDATLADAFANVKLPVEFASRVRQAVSRMALPRPPSALPEVLDFIGWAAVLAIAVVLWYSPALAFLKG